MSRVPASADLDNLDRALQDATSITLRALAAASDLDVSFGPADPSATRLSQQITGGSVTLPRVPASRVQLAEFRGRADRHAFWLRHHDSELAPALQHPDARGLWRHLEQARVDMIGGELLIGCRENLADCLHADLKRESHSEFSGPPPVAVAALLQQALTGIRVDLRGHDQRWIRRLTPMMQTVAEQVCDCLDDQEAFGEHMMRLLADLNLIPPEDQQPESNDEAEDTPHGASSEEDQGQTPLPPELQDTGEGEGEEMPEGQGIPIETDEAGVEVESEPESEEGSWLERELAAAGDDYRVYCRDFDAEVSPVDLCDPTDLRSFRAELNQLAQPYRAIINKLANRLGRLIAAQQNRRWDYDLEEGLLDSHRLYRVISRPLGIAPYKQERTQEFPDTVVSLLIDNSGSQRGKAIALAAISAEIVAATLERCGVRTEILGFTTSAWRGGESRKRWMDAGRPMNPGRLNDLRHILYKPAGMSWRRAQPNMGLMLMPDLLKENIDGEGLIWAHERLMKLPEERRILMVISDGAPVDDSTLSANSPGYLDGHLRAVASMIERKSPVELVAIGIGHDVSRYYARALTLRSAEDLGPAVLDQLAELFARPAGRRR